MALDFYGLSGRLVVVTGGARGIGAAVAVALLEHGAQVVVLDLDDSDERPRRTALEKCNIADPRAVQSTFGKIRDQFGDVESLVNNAGINAHFDAETMSVAQWQSVFDTDVRGAWLCAQQVLPAMREARRGSIVNITSIHARMTLKGFFPYASAKAGLEGLTRSLANDVGEHGIRVNAVAPGYTRTRVVAKWLARESATGGVTASQIDAVHPLARIAEPSEIAAAVCFLLGDAASAITGATLAVDCGLSARFAS